TGIKNGYRIDLGAGDDFLVISGTRAKKGELNVNMGDGNDILDVADTGHRGGTVLKTGAGDDGVILRAGAYRTDLLVDTGTGDDQVVSLGARGKALYLVNPLGTDYF